MLTMSQPESEPESEPDVGKTAELLRLFSLAILAAHWFLSQMAP